MLFIICTLVLLSQTNSQYVGLTDLAVEENSSNSEDNYEEPNAPKTPPRVPKQPSFGYRPPPPPIRRNAKSAGKCSFDQNSWRFEPQTAIANAIMFDRTTGYTCEECIEKCLKFQDHKSEWICRSLTYDHRWKICDLFAVNGTNLPHFLTEYSERDYLEYVHHFQGHSVQTLQYLTITDTNSIEKNDLTASSAEISQNELHSEPVSDYQAIHQKSVGKSGENFCKYDDVTRYATIFNHERLNAATDTQIVRARSMKLCAEACDRDETLTCSSAIHTDKDCELSVSKAEHKNRDDFIFNDNSTYLERICLPKSMAAETEKLWPTVLDHILVGHVMEVADSSSLAECMTACLRAEQELSFVCRSAMWYPNDAEQNCLLNAESRETRANVFVAEDQGVRMFYFEVPRVRKSKQKLNNGVFRDDPVKDDYTRWSKCNKSHLQHRYLKCTNQTDIRKCLQQTKPCERESVRLTQLMLVCPVNTDSEFQESKCIAVRDSKGNKKCPHGVRKTSGGNNKYCRNPIDCNL
ncbi:unnamed protein product [Thelazia callipaeda]|uniref:Apple domain-containing protein n=1 Tax=Thelazia callipaeda TaxID=103827 RepID=A0A0N5CN06_THECL|nr:unnamed protein product [Thelazia callipaeda]